MDNGWNAWLNARRGEMIEDLSELVAIPSVSEDRQNTEKALQYALALGEKIGFRTQSVLGGEVGII